MRRSVSDTAGLIQSRIEKGQNYVPFQGAMDFMRVVLGLLIAASGFVAVLAVLIAFTRLSFPGPIERVGAILLLVLLETAISFATYHAFGKVMGSTPLDKSGT